MDGVLKRKYMATNLFGPSPLELQQAQQGALRAQATQYAQLSPLERASQGLYQAGSNIGGGIAGLMGIQDPAMERQSAIAAIASKYDITKPDDLIKVAQELQAAGFNQEAMAASGKAQELKTAEQTAAINKQNLLTGQYNYEETVRKGGMARQQEGMQAQALDIGKTLYNADGSVNKEVAQSLANLGPVGSAEIERQQTTRQAFQPKTQVLGKRLVSFDPVENKWSFITPEGTKTADAGSNLAQMMIDTKAVDPSVVPFATSIAKNWDMQTPEEQQSGLQHLTTINNAALQRATKKAEAAAGGSDKVQSSKILADGTVISVLKDGGTKVTNSAGEVITGSARTDAVKAAEQFGTDVQGGRAAARDQAGVSAKVVSDAYKQIGNINNNISNLENASAALKAGAKTGVIASKFPSLNESSILLDNVQNNLGLDVVRSVTFGALSQGELSMALATALPTNLNEAALATWIDNKVAAQKKLSKYLNEEVKFLAKGKTIGDWIDFVESKQAKGTNTPTTPPAKVVSTGNPLVDKYLNLPKP